jgi:hypothetical protein
MGKTIYSMISAACAVFALAGPASSADMAIPVPVGTAGGCSGLALVCANGHSYPICPIAISVAGELVTGRLMTSSGGTHIRLMPMGDGYRYAGRGIWFDGKYTEATLYFGQTAAISCNVVSSTTEAAISAKY